MTEPDRDLLLQMGGGHEAQLAMGIFAKHAAAEEERIGREVSKAVRDGTLTPERAILFCTEIAALRALDSRLRNMITAGQEAGRKLEPVLTPSPNPPRREGILNR